MATKNMATATLSTVSVRAQKYERHYVARLVCVVSGRTRSVTKADFRLSLIIFFGGCMIFSSCDIYIYISCTAFGLRVFFPRVFSPLLVARGPVCDHGLDHASQCENNNNNNNNKPPSSPLWFK